MRNLFTISQAVKSCGISRATILRLEEKGLLTPTFVDKKTGYRYYDNHNISRILQIKNFLNMGMSYDDALLYYNSNGKSEELLKIIEDRYLLAKHTYEEMKLRTENKEKITFEFVTLPEYICYQREYSGTTTDDRYINMYNLFHEVVEKEYKPLPSGSLFVINKRTDFIDNEFKNIECDFICCIPLEPDHAPEDAVVYPSCNAFSCLYYGPYRNAKRVYDELGEKIRELGIKPTGYVRAIAIVAPYTGRDINTENYVTRLAVPIE